jgi:hypothetical protein
MAAAHDDPSGNAVIADAAHDAITIQHVNAAQLLAHQNDFHCHEMRAGWFGRPRQ